MPYFGVQDVLDGKDVKSCYIELNNGDFMPIFGLGTYLLKDEEQLTRVLETALSTGYRLIDTATVYHNEEIIGKALQDLQKRLGIARSELFITSKLAPKDQGKDNVRQAVATSLRKLNLSYIDLYLIHWPGVDSVNSRSDKNPILRKESWIELEKCVEDGLIRSIGVSNYNLNHLKQLYEHCKIPPAVNQVEYHLYYRYPEEFVDFCTSKKILLQSYGTLGGGGVKDLLEDEEVMRIANSLGTLPAQILLRWALQNGWAVIPKSCMPTRVIENSELNFEIPENEMSLLNSISKRIKYAWDPNSVL
ncbi:uncharacterized protein LOC106661956 [Cimex lectularius]|uniref:NADP-dependent oxidoreductase domain-containing protein n=1 Tax=Cimex lectularius TaxID=79782 RepID=A0A8I6RCH2_CIMLE|nr:uncharacterized protein LOC106661956 [Cimex lectularius]